MYTRNVVKLQRAFRRKRALRQSRIALRTSLTSPPIASSSKSLPLPYLSNRQLDLSGLSLRSTRKSLPLPSIRTRRLDILGSSSKRLSTSEPSSGVHTASPSSPEVSRAAAHGISSILMSVEHRWEASPSKRRAAEAWRRRKLWFDRWFDDWGDVLGCITVGVLLLLNILMHG